jgi:hypothetical protein
MKNRWIKWLKIIGYNLAVVFVLLLGIEGYLAYMLNHPKSSPEWLFPALNEYYHTSDMKVIQYDRDFAKYDNDLFYTLKPGTFTYTNREFSNKYRVNSAGFRDDEASLKHPKLIVLGDSHSMGWGVDQHETYVARLEKALGYKVLNAGVSSYGTAREMKALSRFSTDSLEYLIVQYCPNDLSENIEFVLQGNRLKVSTRKNWNKACDLHKAKTDYYLFKHLFNIPSLVFKEKPKKKPKPKRKRKGPVPTAPEAFITILKESNDIPDDVKIIVFSLEAERATDHFVKSIKNRLDKEFGSSLHDRISYVDFKGLIDKRHRFLFDSHMNAKGHKVVADEVEKHIRSIKDSLLQKHWLYENGDTALVCDYQNGLKHGIFKGYWASGETSIVSHYKNGVKDGIEMNYSEQGVITRKKQYLNDQLHGWSVVYDTTGLPTDSSYFEAGIVLPER